MRDYSIFKQYSGKNRILLNEPMSKHTYFKIGGNADCLIIVENTDEIINIVHECRALNIPFFIMGNGSNILVSDDGIDGVVIKLSADFAGIHEQDRMITAQTGILLSQLADFVLQKSLAGFEFAHGIPGTLGGAVFMNAGAYGGEMKDVIESVKVLNANGQIITLSNEQMRFSYRHSAAQDEEYVILEASIKLVKGDKSEIKAKTLEFDKSRKEKQPLEYPSAGSTFKRPEGYFAGKLIMDSGLQGFSVGGAQISEKHCGFVINKGNATAQDVLELIKHVQNTVYEKFGVTLEPEVKLIGR